jgi:LacI family transcriptional regulator
MHIVNLIDAIGRRGSHGLLLNAPDGSEVAEAVDRLSAKGIPIVTLMTDLGNCNRDRRRL